MSTSAVQILKSSPLFNDIGAPELEKIASQCSVKELNAGETLFFENEDSKSLFIVYKGTVVIKKNSKNGEDNLTQIGQNSHFGEMAMVMKTGASYEKRSATAEAGGELTIVLEVPYEPLVAHFNANPKSGMCFYRNLSVSLAGRIRRTTEDLTGLKALRLRHT